MDWQFLVAVLINGVGVLAVVQLVKVHLMPFLKAQHPWALPILAVLAGPIVGFATEFLMAFLGYPIDLSAIVAALTGAMAVVAHQVKAQASKGEI